MKIEDLFRIGELFESLGWPTKKDPACEVQRIFEIFCRMCSRLSQEERDLIIRITFHYQWIRRPRDRDLLLGAWDTLVQQLPTGTEILAILPLLKPDSPRPKSSDEMWRLAERYMSNLEDRLSPVRLMFFQEQDVEILLRECGNFRTTLVLIDDYVGTGDTAIRAIDALRAQFPAISSMDLVVLVLAAQLGASARLAGMNCRLIAPMSLVKGISHNPLTNNVATDLAIMDRIGDQLGIPKHERLGYGDTEDLVTLTQTPNNTFPVFWTNKKFGNEDWVPPFKRRFGYER